MVSDENGERVLSGIEEHERLMEALRAADETLVELERGKDEPVPQERAKKEIEEEQERGE